MEKAKKLISLIPCKICGDKCSGKHYGVCSCEGCKSFFRRSLLKNVRYECQHNNCCLTKITRATRNKCQACRFQKCLDAGMGREGVKLGRMTKTAQESMSREVDAVLGESSHIKKTSSSSSMTSLDGSSPVPSSPKVFIEGLSYLSEGEIERNVIAAHMKTCTYTAEEIRAMIVDHDPKSSKLHHSDPDKESLFNSCTRKIGIVIKHIIEFAKDIRAFAEAPNRQIIFLKSATLEILVVRLSRVLDLRNNTVLFGDRFVPINIFTKLAIRSLNIRPMATDQLNIRYLRKYIIAHGLSPLSQGFDLLRFLLEKVFKVAYFLASIRLSEEELALLCSALLINDHSSLQPQPSLTAFRISVLKALARHMDNSHPENSTILLENVFSQIESIRCLHQSHVEFVETAEREWTGVEVDPLYKETLLEDIIDEQDAVDEMTPSPTNPVMADTHGGFFPICNENEVLYQSESRLSPSSFTSTSTSGPTSSPVFDDSNNRVQISHTSRPTSPYQDAVLNNQLSYFSIGCNNPYLPDLGDVADLLPTPPVEVPTSFSYLQVTTQSETSPHEQGNECAFTYF